LSERLQEEQNEVMKKLLSAHCLQDFVDSGLDIKRYPGKEGDFADDAYS